jgi:hypothetical protein
LPLACRTCTRATCATATSSVRTCCYAASRPTLTAAWQRWQTLGSAGRSRTDRCTAGVGVKQRFCLSNILAMVDASQSPCLIKQQQPAQYRGVLAQRHRFCVDSTQQRLLPQHWCHRDLTEVDALVVHCSMHCMMAPQFKGWLCGRCPVCINLFLLCYLI